MCFAEDVPALNTVGYILFSFGYLCDKPALAGVACIVMFLSLCLTIVLLAKNWHFSDMQGKLLLVRGFLLRHLPCRLRHSCGHLLQSLRLGKTRVVGLPGPEAGTVLLPSGHRSAPARAVLCPLPGTPLPGGWRTFAWLSTLK